MLCVVSGFQPEPEGLILQPLDSECTRTSKIPKMMDPMLAILSVFEYWAIILVGGPRSRAQDSIDENPIKSIQAPLLQHRVQGGGITEIGVRDFCRTSLLEPRRYVKQRPFGLVIQVFS